MTEGRRARGRRSHVSTKAAPAPRGHRFSLLTDALLSVRDAAGQRESLTLPVVLSRLGRGDELEPLALRAHQHHAWHAFLVQLGALVAHRSGNQSLDRSPDLWREGLLELAGDAGEDAWSLLVSDLSRPAFLQCPVTEGSLAKFKNTVSTPDSLDVVITAKNHDVKAGRLVAPAPEHWIYALVTLQTMQGFLGQGNYGIARMNGGFGSRPAVAAAPGFGWSERFRRDIGVWLDAREELIESYGYARSGGHPLLWLLPWDGSSSRGLSECDPFFIEVCRRVRVEEQQGHLVALATPTKASFLQTKEQRGDTGDIWTPVKADATALTVGPSGFSYRLLADLLLSGNYPRKPALAIRSEDGKEPLLVAEVLVRGQGVTEGYYRRVVPIPAAICRRLLSSEGVMSLGTIARQRIERAATAQRSVLKPALCTLLQDGDDLDFGDKRVRPWLDRFDAAVDRIFFPELWEAAERPAEEHERAWDERLRDLAREQLEDAFESAPVPLARRPRARARAELIFFSAAHKHLFAAYRRDEAKEERS